MALDTGGTPLAGSPVLLGPNGSAVVDSGTLAASAPSFDIRQEWGNALVTFTGWKLNITNTASAAASLLMDLQVGGTSMVSADRAGNVIFGPSTNPRSYMNAGPFNGDVRFGNAASGFTSYINHNDKRFQTRSDGAYAWSSTTTVDASPDTAIMRSAAGVVEVNSSTAGTFRDLKLRNLLTAGGNGSYVQTPSMTVANLAAAGTAGAGARAFVTDATATTFLSTVAGGGANKVPVVSDGTSWLIG